MTQRVLVGHHKRYHPRRHPKIHHLADLAAMQPGGEYKAICGQVEVCEEDELNKRLHKAGADPVSLAQLPLCQNCTYSMVPACTKKMSYRDKIAAELAIVAIRGRDVRSMDRFERRAYYCERHRAWHLTSRSRAHG